MLLTHQRFLGLQDEVDLHLKALSVWISLCSPNPTMKQKQSILEAP